MASKYSTNIQITHTKDFVKETIAVTGSVLSGTYPDQASTLSNIKNHDQGMYQTCHDYPYLSQSSNPLFDITVGYLPNSLPVDLNELLVGSTAPVSGTSTDILAKQNIYKQMAAVMLGYNQTGSLRVFDVSGNFNTQNTATVMRTPIFINFSRLMMKDEIRKGSFELTIGTGSHGHAFNAHDVASAVGTRIITDSGSVDLENGLRILKETTNNGNVGILDRFKGIAAIQLSSSNLGANSIFGANGDTVGHLPILFVSQSQAKQYTFGHAMISGTILECATGMRHRIQNISIKNATQLNVANYLCTAGANDFNYSSNPSYVNTSSQIQVRLDSDGSVNKNNPAYAYITGVGLYASDGELMAVGKFSKPIKKDASKSQLISVKLTH